MTGCYTLVRSPRSLVEREEVGYGWAAVNFSEYASAEALLQAGFAEKGIGVGRKKNQIKRFYNLQAGEIVVVPVAGAIAFARVEGTKVYNGTAGIRHAENRVRVSYFKDSSGNAFVPRQVLSTEFQSRLKIRMAIADLSDFADEIDKHLASLEQGAIYTWKSELEAREEQDELIFKEKLLSRLKSGNKISLAAGGYGLEKLVCELLEINGYVSRIQAKNQSSGEDDIDIIASKHNFLTGDVECLYVQVKHHRGTTGLTGLKQLTAYQPEEDCALVRKVLISTACFGEALKAQAERAQVVLIEGPELVDLLYNHIEQLSDATRASLGITTTPQLI